MCSTILRAPTPCGSNRLSATLLTEAPGFPQPNQHHVTNDLYCKSRKPHTWLVPAKRSSSHLLTHPRPDRRSDTDGPISLPCNILPATHSFSIFYRQFRR